MTVGVLIKSAFYFTKDVALHTNDMYTYLYVSSFVAAGGNQIMSIFKYHQILPFWDGLSSRCPQVLSGTLKKPKIIIGMMIIFQLSGLAVVYVTSFCYLLGPDQEPLLLRLAQPWPDRRVAWLVLSVTMFSILPAFISWSGTNTLFLVAAYYLHRGFRRLGRTMEDDEQLLAELASYKTRHRNLSRLTALLDDILKGYIGVCVATCAFNLCIVIFTIKENQDIIEMIISINILMISSLAMAAITVISISLNSWVSIRHRCECSHRSCLSFMNWELYFGV